MNWQGDAASEIAKLDPEATARLEAYAAGINARLRQGVPWGKHDFSRIFC